MTLRIYHRGDTPNLAMFEALAKGNQMEFIDIDLSEEGISGTRLLQLSNKLGEGIQELIDTDSELFQNSLSNKKYDEADLLDILSKHPELIRLPIAESQKEVRILEKPRDILGLQDIKENIESHDHDKNIN